MAKRKMTEWEKRNYQKRFMKGFDILCKEGKNRFEVWNDLMTVFAIEIQNSCTRPLKDTEEFSEVWNKREQEYITVMKKYSEYERKIISQMFSLIVMELDKNPDQDLLGKLYMLLEISSKHAGQFFTPFHISRMMSEITFDKKTVSRAVKEHGYFSIYDAACGAGGMFMAAISRCRELFKKLNFQNHIFIHGQDIDLLCVRMCYIQVSLLGVAGIFKHGNTLSDPFTNADFKNNLNSLWFTPMYFSDVWQYRILFHGGLSSLFPENIKKAKSEK